MKIHFLVAVALLLSGCKVDRKEDPKMHSESVKIHCVGRHLISIPSSFDASSIITGIFKVQGADAQDPDVDIVVQSDITTKTKFDAVVQQRRAELTGSESKTVDVLKLDKVLPDGSTLFRVQEIDDAYFSEMYLLRGAAMIKMKLESYGNSYLKAEERMSKLAADMVARNQTESVGISGFCLGPVLVKSSLSQEVGIFTFRDNGGLIIELNIDTFSRDDSVPLLSRMSRDSSILQELKVRTKVLRAQERTAAGMSAEEWLGIGYLGKDEGERSLKFMLETRRKNPGKASPIISLSLDSAQPLKDGTSTTTKIGNEEAMELWDQIVDSIRIADEHPFKS